jgi:hypothetical protein
MPARCADRRLQCSANPIDQSQGTAVVSGDPTGQCHTVDHVQRGRQQDWTYSMQLKISFATPSH